MSRSERERLWGLAALLLAFGGTLFAIGCIDLGFAWFPLRLGVGEWEFGVVSRTFDGLVLVMLGVLGMVGGAVLRGSRLLLTLALVLAIGGLLFLLGCVVLYGLNAPIALRQIPAEARPSLVRAMSRTSMFMVVYLLFASWLTIFTWRQRRSVRATRTGE